MKFPADHIRDLWRGLQKSYLIDYDALLSGYAPSREAVEAVGSIARDLRYHATGKPGSFFWGEFYTYFKSSPLTDGYGSIGSCDG